MSQLNNAVLRCVLFVLHNFTFGSSKVTLTTKFRAFVANVGTVSRKRFMGHPGYEVGSYSGYGVFLEHEKPGYSNPCIHDSNSIQVSGQLFAVLS